MTSSQTQPDLKTPALVLGPIVACLASALMWFSGGGSEAACLTLGITVWVVIWWIFEPIPDPCNLADTAGAAADAGGADPRVSWVLPMDTRWCCC